MTSQSEILNLELIDTLWRAEQDVQILEDEWQIFQPRLYEWVEEPSPSINGLSAVCLLEHSGGAQRD